MRIITGSARGRKLTAPPGMDTRPTSEIVKEAVFSMIQFEIEGARVLDLFAGSGQIGLEAVSRGARSCIFVDNAKAAHQAITENVKISGFEQQCRIVRSDVFSWLEAQAQRGGDRYDIAFLDPPYRQNMLAAALPLAAELMSDGGIIICETAKGESLPETAGAFKIYREYKYGAALIVQYRAE